MIDKVDTATVSLWGQTVGAVSWLEQQGYAVFEYEPAFLKKDLDIAPVHMSLEQARGSDATFFFPALNKDTFLGLPGLLADALPDKFGNSIIDAWLARQGRDQASFSPVERLCYTGKRAMGALEFTPTVIDKPNKAVPIDINELVLLTQEIMQERKSLDVELDPNRENSEAISDILRVGTSAGGARPKAVIAMNDKGHVVSGQADVPADYDYWILKFDGVTDLELGEPRGFGRIEYAYYRMAQAAGLHMSPCRLLEENSRAHFMTRRFDRVNGEKIHMQSLCGLAHFDFNMAGAYSYEQAFQVMRQLRLSKAEAVQLYRRMLFNVIARNLDDHTKNIAFLMDNQGQWTLSPAFDVTYAHNPAGRWTHQHQMSINGKRRDIHRQDLIDVGLSISLSRPDQIIEEVLEAIARWPQFADEAGVPSRIKSEIQSHLHLNL